MKDRETGKRLLILLISAAGMFAMVGFYAWIWFGFYYPNILVYDIKLYFNGHILILLIYTVILFLFSNLYGGLKIGYLKPMEVFLSQIFSLICVNVMSYFQLALIHGNLIWPVPFFRMMAGQLLFSAVWIYFANLVYRRIFPPRRLLLIHGDRSIDDILHKFASRKDKYRIEKCMGLEEGAEALLEELEKGYGGVVLWDIPTAVRNKLLKYCYSRSIRIYLMPKIPDVIIKRCIDIVCSLILLVIASPFMLVTAAAIKLYDGGPVLYRQIRCTRGGKEFAILKFRSMRVDAEKDGVARLAAKHDSRITPIGRFIRAVRIDELPQLINILKGEMSFIGPRPERPEIIAQYLEEMPEFAFRTKVKAGLAGYAQVYGKYNTTPYDKLKLDLTYIESYSVWLDIRLMLLTLKILFRPESTEGVDEKQITAMKREAQEDNK